MTSIICRHCSVGAPATGPSSITPALLTRMSRPPELLARALDEGVGLGLVGDVGLDRERAAAVALDPLREIVDPVLAAGRERDAAPSATSASAVASPIPDEAPVIAATFRRAAHGLTDQPMP